MMLVIKVLYVVTPAIVGGVLGYFFLIFTNIPLVNIAIGVAVCGFGSLILFGIVQDFGFIGVLINTAIGIVIGVFVGYMVIQPRLGDTVPELPWVAICAGYALIYPYIGYVLVSGE